MKNQSKKPKRLQFSNNNKVKLGSSDKNKDLRTFEMLAYTGKAVNGGFGDPIILDVSGIEIAGPPPILRNHNSDQVVGFSTDVKKTDNKNIEISGVVSGSTSAGKEVAQLADEGFPWQASIGFEIEKVTFLDSKEEKQVNGSTFQGPGLVVTKSRLTESSFVPAGADGATTATVFSNNGCVLKASDFRVKETKQMNWDEIKKTLGIKEDITDENAQSLILSLWNTSQEELSSVKTELNSLKAMKDKAPDEPDPTLLNLAAENREMKLSALVAASRITPAVKDKLSDAFIGKDNMKLSASLKGLSEDSFDSVVKILAENDPIGIKEKSGAQVLGALADDRKTVEDDSLVKNMEKFAASSGGKS